MLIARPLFQMRTRLFASAGYLASLPPIRHPRDLAAVNALVIAGRDSDRTWVLSRGRERASVAPHGNVEVNDLGTLVSLAAAGAGVALLPESKLAGQAVTGSLVPVLDSWRGPDAPVFAVYASRRMPMRLRLFLDHLREWSS
jgi:DNA-binding transcriptional LysR family regulator